MSKLRTKGMLAIILTVSILTSTLILSLPLTVSAATPLFGDDFETKDYSHWSGTVNYTGSLMQISSDPVFEGNYSADCALSGSIGTYAYAYTNLSTPPTTLYHREYIQVSSLPPAGAGTDLFGIMDIVGSGHHLGTIGIQNDGSNYLWRVKYYNGGDEVAYSPPTNIKSGTWYYVEIMVKSGAGNGQVSVWIAEDLTAITQASPTIDLQNLMNNANPDRAIFFGGYTLGASYPVHIYSDNVVVSDTWTGPRDFTDPTIGAITATSHSSGASVTLISSITDDVGVDSIIPSWNNTGTWVNQTTIEAHGSLNYTATLTGNWNSIPGTVVSVRFYANDTSNNWASGQANFALSNYFVTLSANQTGLIQEGTVIINLNVTKDGLPLSNYVANVSRDGSIFLTNQTSNFTDSDIHSAMHTYNISSLYDLDIGENVTFTTNTLNVVWAKNTYTIILYTNQSVVTQKDTVNFYLNVTKNGLVFNSYLANVTKDGALFASNSTGSFNDTENAVVEHTYLVSSLYDLISAENATFTTNMLNVTWTQAPPIATPTPRPAATPTPKPTATPTPKSTATPTPSATVSPSPIATLTPTPKSTQEGLSIATIAAIIVVVIVIIVIVLLLLVKTKKIKI